jgi:FKBP-type peptidyl-prolyl cis-trans isomerase
MKTTQTAIATALALTVVAFFFIFGGMSNFATPAPTDNSNVGITNNAETASTTATTATTTLTMPTEPVTQLMMKDTVIGTGALAATGDSVTVNYVGALTNGTVFDASANHAETANGFIFTLGAGQVIKGWDQGVAGMKVGGKRILIIPADLAYGSQSPSPAIPANSTLVFEVELLKVVKP